MPKWEYWIVDTLATSHLLDYLNKMGKDGWEICASLGFGKGVDTLVLKRPLE